MFKSIWKILGFLAGFSTQAETQTQTQAEIQIKTQAEVQAEIHTLIDLIKDDNFLEFKKRLSSARGDELLNTLKYISDNSGIDLRYISNISDVLRQEGKQSLLNEIYNYSLNSSNILLQKTIGTVRQDVEFENSALERLQELHKGKMAHDNRGKILTPIAEASKEDDANERFPNLMAFIEAHEPVELLLNTIHQSGTSKQYLLQEMKSFDSNKESQTEKENRDTDHKTLELLKCLKRDNRATHPQIIPILQLVANDVLSNEGSCAIYTETEKFANEDDVLRKLLNDIKEDMNLLQELKSFNSDNAEDMQKFQQIKEKILKEEAKLLRTWKYVRENGSNYFCNGLQTEKESRNLDNQNRNLDYNALQSLEDCLQCGASSTISTIEEILKPVAQDELLNNGGVYIKTIEHIKRIGENELVLQVYNSIIAHENDLNLLQKLKSFDSNNVGDRQKFKEIKAELLEKQAEFSITWRYICENRHNPFFNELQTERENRERDDSALKSLESAWLERKFSTIERILIPVVKDKLFNAGGVYKKTTPFINEHSLLREIFDDTVKEEEEQVEANSSLTDPATLNVKENSLAQGNTL
ncbi:hypothetical protein [Wolbachia endosymbiont of Folsomia candida]|uniref:hypothetical protein n=1 Tax=Wolbachia endosymbiont of Folsomia candida TaxID=169402 RepID=UPI000AE1B6F8|nr:hypothetical protein [Wolbachia endosymbiont of Folsomia candida]APR98535.1 hypothetical protein ASM33_04715 [Wolbachia endosymbiont of Folsomia candida]